VDQNFASDLTADISVDESRAQARGMAAGAGSGGGGQTYTVKSGDTLSKISKQFYGDSHEYMKIFYANQGTLSDPNNIDVGQELHIPDANS
jgi:nucleoid-associated protein YgaU